MSDHLAMGTAGGQYVTGERSSTSEHACHAVKVAVPLDGSEVVSRGAVDVDVARPRDRGRPRGGVRGGGAGVVARARAAIAGAAVAGRGATAYLVPRQPLRDRAYVVGQLVCLSLAGHVAYAIVSGG